MPLKLREAADLFLGRYSNAGTLKAYRSTLDLLCNALGPERRVDSITKIDLERYKQDLENNNVRYSNHPRRFPINGKLSPQTVRRHIKATRLFFKWLTDLDELVKNPSQILKAPGARPALDHKEAARDDEIEILRQAFFGDARNHALFRFLVDTGCRAGEVATLTQTSCDLENTHADVVGKFSKTYRVWFSPGTAQALRWWLLSRPHWRHDYVFGTQEGHLKPNTITEIIKRKCKKIGLRPLSAHQFRYAKGFALAKAGVHPAITAIILGHESPEIAMRYYTPKDLEMAEKASRATHIRELGDPTEILFLPSSKEVKSG